MAATAKKRSPCERGDHDYLPSSDGPYPKGRERDRYYRMHHCRRCGNSIEKLEIDYRAKEGEESG